MIKICSILFLALAPYAHAEDPEYDSNPVSDGSEVDVNEIFIENATMVTGKIRSIDFAEGSTIISGFRYHFGSATGIDRSVVRMLNRDFGAVELLQVNMFVKVYYVQEPGRRLAKLIIQIDAGEEF